jgi:hypothetical protein
VPALHRRLRGGDGRPGGVAGYPSERLYEEVAYVSYYLHWPYDQVMEMEHRERQRWVAEVARINKRINEQAK